MQFSILSKRKVFTPLMRGINRLNLLNSFSEGVVSIKVFLKITNNDRAPASS
jgi:hypothetical protein